jgi:polyisoprenoid-binding protein YceI
LVASAALAGELPGAVRGSRPAACSIRFDGSSSLHNFGGDVGDLAVSLLPSANAGRWNADFGIPVAAMTTGNESRDARMREMLHADRSPEIRIALREVDPDQARRASRLDGTLTIDGNSRPFTATLANWRDGEAGPSFDAAATISLADFGLVAPTVLGLIRVADPVEIHAHVDVGRGG